MLRRWVRVAFLLPLGGSIACESNPGDQELLDASLDQSAPFCSTDKDCANGLVCSYEILVGCKAKGECRELGFEGGAGDCLPASKACGFDGRTVDVPACWMGFAPVPVLPSGTPCGD